MADVPQTLDELLALYNAPRDRIPAYLWPDPPAEAEAKQRQLDATPDRMKQWEPRYLSNNVGPMVSDAARAVLPGTSIADRLGREAETAASWSPPGAVLDAASDIGGALHRGDTREAMMRAAIWNALRMVAGYAGRGAYEMIPKAANRDIGISRFMERQPQMTDSILAPVKDGSLSSYIASLHHGYPVQLSRMGMKKNLLETEVRGLNAGSAAPSASSGFDNAANANTRKLRPYLEVVE